MQGGNRFLDFAEQVIARHRGLGFGFEPAAMLYLEDQEQSPLEQAAPHQSFTTNLYHIQNIKEENYLFKQNLSFLTQILENKMYQNLYPSVEKQIEKVIREEMPQAETKIIHSVSEQLYRLVKQGGVEQFELVREKVFSEYKETEKITLKEQEKLFRKIENIWNSSIYQQTVQNSYTTIDNSRMNLENNYLNMQDSTKNIQNNYVTVQQHQFLQTEIVHPEVIQTESIQNNQINNREIEHTESVLERTLKFVETQNQILTNIQNQKSGNLGKNYARTVEVPYVDTITETLLSERNVKGSFAERIIESYARETEQEKVVTHTHTMEQVPLEYVQEQSVQSKDEIHKIIQQSSVEQNTEIQKQLERKSIHLEHPSEETQKQLERKSIHLEYPSEETTQFHQEVIQMLSSEIQRIPEVPKSVIENTETELQRTQMIERSKTISEQILSRMETIGIVPVSQTMSVTKTVAFNKLSHAILEYAESKTTSEELQTNMMRILEDYQTEFVSVPGTDSTRIIYNNNAEVVTFENLKHHVNHRLIQKISHQEQAPALIQSMEPAAIVYHSEESAVPEQQEKTKQLEKQVNEVVKTIKNVEQRTIVQKEQLIEEQRKVVHEVLKENPTIWTEGKGAGYIRTEVQQSVEEQINQSVNQIANRVYRRLQDKLKSERGRRGLI